MAAITSSGEDSIRRSINVSPVLNLSENFEQYFQVCRCVEWIKENNYQRVALQFPDELLHLAVLVQNGIASKIGSSRVYLIADSTYGSCCIDEKTSAHINADALIHFGHSCGSSRSTKLPVQYIYVRPDVDIERIVTDFTTTFRDKSIPVGILYDFEYQDIATQLLERLSDYGAIEMLKPESLEDIGDDESSPPPSKIFYMTSTERAVINRILQIHRKYRNCENSPQVTIYNPSTSGSIQTPSVHKLLMKRNYYIEKLREADTIGILVGTLSVDNYIDVIKHLKAILKQAGKKSYLVSIGEINAPKLANFPDINAFVLVACPEATLIESKEFYQVVATPWEVEVAFGRQNDQADYFVDYRVLIPGGDEHVEFAKYTGRNIYADVSLINGVSRIGINWQGLEELPAEQDFKIHEGQSGIASCYSSEPQCS